MKSVQQRSVERESSMKAGKSKGNGPVITDSAMLDKERKQLEKIKLKQQQELQQMMEYELKMQQIRQTNEEKLQMQKEREEKRQKELMKKQREQEEEKRQQELEKKKRLEEEAERQKQKQREIFEKEFLLCVFI